MAKVLSISTKELEKAPTAPKDKRDGPAVRCSSLTAFFPYKTDSNNNLALWNNNEIKQSAIKNLYKKIKRVKTSEIRQHHPRNQVICCPPRIQAAF